MRGKVKKENIQFIIMWIWIAIVLCIRYYDGEIKNINGTMMAFHYGYGFISRGFIGSIYAMLDKILPGSMYTYPMAMKFIQLMTGMFLVMLMAFVYLCQKKVKKSAYKSTEYLILFLTIFAVPMFVSKYNFGRLDLYLVMISLLGTMLLIQEKAEWLIIPLTAMGIMIHQGYAFMYYNILLVLVFYKWMSATDTKKRKKYQIIFFTSLVICVVLFFWFEVFSHVNGEAIVGDICRNATGICQDSPDGEYHKDVIDHEILGIDLTAKERPWQLMNRVQFPFFILMFLPYIIIAVGFFKRVWKSAEDTRSRLKYLALILGALTMLPEFVIKVDYGRWIFAVICYYCIVVLALAAMGDEVITNSMETTHSRLNRTLPLAILLLLYAVLFQPCMDVCINDVVGDIAQFLNQHFLHLWSETVYYR